MAASELQARQNYIYLANCAQKHALFNLQAYFEAEADSEQEHYYKLRDFANDTGWELETSAVEEPDLEDESVKGILAYVEAFEVQLLKDYDRFYPKASPTTQAFLVKMLKIQTKGAGEAMDNVRLWETCNGIPALFDQNFKK